MLMNDVDAYLAIRRVAGFELEVPEYLLRSYASYAAQKGQDHVNAQTAIEWASQAPSKNQRFNRLATAIRFATHVQLEDPCHEIPPRGIFGNRRVRRVPFIFSTEQSDRFLLAATHLGPPKSLRPQTYSTLFGLLFATGLRISEALALLFDDVTDDGLIIRKTKFKKSRIVPIQETTRVGLEKYLRCRSRIATFDNHIFISLRERVLQYSGVNWTFHRILKDIGLSPAPDGRCPRVHDMRHTFASYLAMTGEDIKAIMELMCHKSITSTMVYAKLSPEYLQKVSNRFSFGPIPVKKNKQ